MNCQVLGLREIERQTSTSDDPETREYLHPYNRENTPREVSDDVIQLQCEILFIGAFRKLESGSDGICDLADPLLGTIILEFV